MNGAGSCVVAGAGVGVWRGCWLGGVVGSALAPLDAAGLGDGVASARAGAGTARMVATIQAETNPPLAARSNTTTTASTHGSAASAADLRCGLGGRFGSGSR